MGAAPNRSRNVGSRVAGGTIGAPFSAYSFVVRQKSQASGGTQPAGCELTVKFSEQWKSRSRGCAPARRLHFFVRPKKRSKEMRPNSLPFGFPPFRCVLQLRKKLAALKHFSSNSCKTPLHSGCVTRGGSHPLCLPPKWHNRFGRVFREVK